MMSEIERNLQEFSGQDQIHFSAILKPYRSLSSNGFLVVMGLIGGISFIAGIVFFLIGAWPVVGFLGLDVLLIYYAFKLNYRSGQIYETIDLINDDLKVSRYDPSGNYKCWTFNPYWVRLDIHKPRERTITLTLSSHQKRLVIGDFLTNDEKEDFARALNEALVSYRGGVRI